MVINNLIPEIKIKKPDTSQQGDDQIKTNKQSTFLSLSAQSYYNGTP